MQAMLQHTHLQPAVAGTPASSRTGQWMEIIRNVQASSGSGTTARVGALWTGVGATLARDVPFSALYWALLEPVRTFLLPAEQASSASAAPQPGPATGPTYRPHSFSPSPPGAGPAPASPAPQQPTDTGLSQPADVDTQSDINMRSSEDHTAASGHGPVRWAYTQHAQRSPGEAASDAQNEASSSGQSRLEAGQLPWVGRKGSQSSARWQGRASSSPDARQEQQHPHQGQFHGRCQERADGSHLEGPRAAELKDRGYSQASSTPWKLGCTGICHDLAPRHAHSLESHPAGTLRMLGHDCIVSHQQLRRLPISAC